MPHLVTWMENLSCLCYSLNWSIPGVLTFFQFIVQLLSDTFFCITAPLYAWLYLIIYDKTAIFALHFNISWKNLHFFTAYWTILYLKSGCQHIGCSRAFIKHCYHSLHITGVIWIEKWQVLPLYFSIFISLNTFHVKYYCLEQLFRLSFYMNFYNFSIEKSISYTVLVTGN